MGSQSEGLNSGAFVTVIPCKCLILLKDMKEQSPLAADVAIRDAEDRELVRLIQGGDRNAERLVTRHQRWIYNIALRMVYFPHDAEDATQESSTNTGGEE